jgi:hypothetical protein
MDPRSNAPITSSSGNSTTSSYATAPTSRYVNEATPGATFDAVNYEFKKNVTRNNTQGFWLPDCFLKALCKAKINRRVAAVLAAKPEGYVWSLMDYAKLARQRSHDRQPQADRNYGAATAPKHEQEVNKDDFYTPGHPQLTPTATSDKEKHGKDKKSSKYRMAAWSPEWIAFHSNPRDHHRECRYCRESSRDHQGNITHTIVKCGKL